MITNDYQLNNAKQLQTLNYLCEQEQEMTAEVQSHVQEENPALKLDPTRTKTIGNYVLGKTIGKGTFGKVKLATHILTGQKVAVKILEKERIVDVADVQRVSRQIHILKLIRHPGIIQLYQIIETPKHLFLIMEYMEGGELFDHIVKCKKVTQEEACRIFQQIIGGVEYIHQLNIVHRDLKPQNLLIDYDNTIRIVDFGLSNTYRKDQRLKTACGSPCYAAPEMIEGKNKYEPLLVDIWSCGVILYAMLCGCLPFQDPQTSKLYQKILAGQYKIPKTLSPDAKDLIGKVLAVDPSKRYRIQQIRKHKWWRVATMENNFSHGIIVGYNRIPVQKPILEQAAKLGFDGDFTRKCIEANRHNNATTTYYLLLKKFVRNGGVSNTALSSQHFDPVLIEPPKRIKPVISSSPKHESQNSNVQIPKNLQTSGLTRKNYMIHKQKIQKVSRQKQLSSIDRSRQSRQQYKASTSKQLPGKRGRSLNSREQRIIDSTSKLKQSIQNILYEPGDDVISKKYRETYGTSIVSKSKDRSRRRSLRKEELSSTDKGKTEFHFNRTIDYQSKKTRNYKLGADLGYEPVNNTIDYSANNNNRPYIRRIIYH